MASLSLFMVLSVESPFPVCTETGPWAVFLHSEFFLFFIASLFFWFCGISFHPPSCTFSIPCNLIKLFSIKKRDVRINLFPVYIINKLIIHGFLCCQVQYFFSLCLGRSLKMKYSIHATWPLQGLINLLEISCSSHQNNPILFLKSAKFNSKQNQGNCTALIYCCHMSISQ